MCLPLLIFSYFDKKNYSLLLCEILHGAHYVQLCLQIYSILNRPQSWKAVLRGCRGIIGSCWTLTIYGRSQAEDWMNIGRTSNSSINLQTRASNIYIRFFLANRISDYAFWTVPSVRNLTFFSITLPCCQHVFNGTGNSNDPCGRRKKVIAAVPTIYIILKMIILSQNIIGSLFRNQRR